VRGSSEQEPGPGLNLVLTIDENIQFMAERALDGVMDKMHADSGTVVVQDVHTGQVLALAVRPTFNPNISRKTTPALLRDHAVSDIYEPGSVFKLVTYSAALEQRVVTPDDKIDCQGGAMSLPGRIIHDDKGDHFGVITVHEALEHSSDVAAVKLVQKIGQDKFYDYIRALVSASAQAWNCPVRRAACCNPSSAGAPHRMRPSPSARKSASRLCNWCPWSPPSPTAASICRRTCCFPARWMLPRKSPARPYRSALQAGRRPAQPAAAGAHRVISTLTAAQMRKMMEGVVLYGTGKAAQLNGYSSGGKTGTAQKIDPATHTYSKTMHIASFAGIAPVNNPVISVAVVIDDPKGASYYGAAVSAPVFAQVAQQVLEYLGVPHDIDMRAPKTSKDKPALMVAEDDDEHSGDINALFAAANDLPSDDPLRSGQIAQAQPMRRQRPPACAVQTSNAVRQLRIGRQTQTRRSAVRFQPGPLPAATIQNRHGCRSQAPSGSLAPRPPRAQSH
jgi:cell division protein FtsI (penicillin-binding protein 3)